MVVVMFENRSFDGLLGYCYQATDPPPRNQTFNGLAGKEYRNPVPAYINDGNADVATRISPGTEADMQNPNPDPGEEYQHVNTALFSIVNPITNQFLDAGAMLSPYNAPRPERRRRCRASSGTIATTSSRSTSATRRSKNIG
jgi:phospholipase C